MLEHVDPVVAQRRLVERGRVPGVEVERPQHQRDDGVREDAQAVDHGVAQQRREHRPGEAEHEQEPRDVTDQQMLGHVGQEQLVGEVADGRGERDGEDEQPGDERPAPPRLDRTPLRGERATTPVVRDPIGQQDEREDDRPGRTGGGEWRHGPSLEAAATQKMSSRSSTMITTKAITAPARTRNVNASGSERSGLSIYRR